MSSSLAQPSLWPDPKIDDDPTSPSCDEDAQPFSDKVVGHVCHAYGSCDPLTLTHSFHSSAVELQ
jgi:hypothetical protein